MTFLELRKQLLQISGRSDLVDSDTYADTGIGHYLNAGQRWLDIHFIGKNMLGRHFKQWPAGTYTVYIPACRAIKEVWAYNDTRRWQLEKKDLDWLRTNFSSSWRSISRGTPVYYAPTVLREFPESTELTAGDATYAANQANVLASSAFNYDGITIMSPLDVPTNIEVWGLFHSNKFLQDDDISWWSVRYSDVLINATLRAVEISHRNTQGVNDWTNAIIDILGPLDQDQVTEDSEDINQMIG